MHPALKLLTANSGYLAGASALNALLRAAYVLALARLLSPELYGLFNYAGALASTLLALTLFGMGVILSRGLAQGPSSGPSLLGLTLFLRTILALGATLACAAWAALVENEIEVQRVLYIFALALFARSLSLWAQQAFTAFEANRHTAILDALYRPAEVIAGLGAALLTKDIVWVAVVHAVSWWLQAGSALFAVRRRLSPAFRFSDLPRIGRIFKQGLPIGLTSAGILWLTQGWFLMQRFSDGITPELGYMAVALQGLMLLNILPATLATTSIPVLSRAHARGDPRGGRYVSLAVSVIYMLGMVVVFAVVPAVPAAVEFMFGQRYSRAGTIAVFVVWFVLPFTAGNLIHSLLHAYAKDRVALVAVLLSGGAMPLVYFLLLESGVSMPGIVAGAFGLLAWNGILLYQCIHRLRLLEGSMVKRAVIISAAGAGVFLFVRAYSLSFASLGGAAIVVLLIVLFKPISSEAFKEVWALVSTPRDDQSAESGMPRVD